MHIHKNIMLIFILNPLITKSRLLYLTTQFVPRSKHFSSRLYKPISLCSMGQKSLFFSNKYKIRKYSVGRAYNCWTLKLLEHHVTSRLQKVKREWKFYKACLHNREEWKKLLRTARIVAFCTCQWNEWNVYCVRPLSFLYTFHRFGAEILIWNFNTWPTRKEIIFCLKLESITLAIPAFDFKGETLNFRNTLNFF